MDRKILPGYSGIIIGLLISLSGLQSKAQDTAKVTYSLFKPVPKDKLPEDMETDRPSVTESPYTVPAGHIQYEADLVRHERESTEQESEQRWLINQANIKLGILNNTAIQLIVQSYGRQTDIPAGTGSKEISGGFGDITLRIKQNIYGNTKGTFSIAVMPYVKFPTNKFSDNKAYEEGLIVPMVIKLPHEWRIGLQAEADYLKDEEGQSHHAELLQSLVISHVLLKKLEVFGESYYTYDIKQRQVQNFLDAALQFELADNVKIDAGLNYGLQKEAEKDYFVGIAFRY